MLLSISDVHRIQVKRIISTCSELVTTLVMYGGHPDHDIGHKHSPALEPSCLVFLTSAGFMRDISSAPGEKCRSSSSYPDHDIGYKDSLAPGPKSRCSVFLTSIGYMLSTLSAPKERSWLPHC